LVYSVFIQLIKIMYVYNAVPWSPLYDEQKIPPQKDQAAGQEEWTWEEILDGTGPWTQAGEDRRP
jgi:hypothetical protein